MSNFTFGPAAGHVSPYITTTTTGISTGSLSWAGHSMKQPEPEGVPAEKTVVVILPLVDLFQLSDAEVWQLLEDDLAVEADEIYIRRAAGRYRVIKPMVDAGTEILSSAEQRAELEAIHRRLKGTAEP